MKAAEYVDRCHFGDVRVVMRQMIADSVKVQTIVTSPPYWGLHSYLPVGHPDKAFEVGSEPTFALVLAIIVEVMRHHNALAEGAGLWKLNGQHTRYLARLFALLHPSHNDLFKSRAVKAARHWAAANDPSARHRA